MNTKKRRETGKEKATLEKLLLMHDDDFDNITVSALKLVKAEKQLKLLKKEHKNEANELLKEIDLNHIIKKGEKRVAIKKHPTTLA